MDFPFDIEDAFAAAVTREAGDLCRKVFAYEPREFGAEELPGVAIFWVAVDDEDTQTGPVTDATWRWRVNVYGSLRAGYEQGQREMRALVPRVLDAVRHDPNLADGSLERGWFARISDPGGEPEIDHDEKAIWKTLNLTVRREET